MADAAVIGVGNAVRGDDGAGIAVARAVRALGAADVLETDGEATALIAAWDGREAVVLVDTMRSGAPPGTVRRFDASAAPLPARLGGSSSTHAFSVGEAIELARALDRLPARVVVYAIEGARFAAGEGLSDAVAAAVPAVARRVLAEIRG